MLRVLRTSSCIVPMLIPVRVETMLEALLLVSLEREFAGTSGD
jgi:hypothetical protein